MTSNDELEAFDSIVPIAEMFQERSYTLMSKFFDDLFAVYSSKMEKPYIPDQIDSNYTGIHLNDAYEEADLIKMIESFKNGQMIHAKYALKILSDAINVFQARSNVSECNFKKAKTKLPSCIIVGDLHGSFKDLCYIIDKFGLPGKNYRFVFNGDFVDRGPNQSEVLFTLLYSALLFPSRVFLNRGNHENLSLNLNKHFDPNFKKETELKFNIYGLAVFNQAIRLFKRLPLATVVENLAGFKVFVTHGGISSRLDLDYISSNKLNRFSFASITIKGNEDSERKKMAEQITDLLWSDPITSQIKSPSKTGCYPNENRGIGWLFGADVSESFCRKYGFNAIIRSHEVRPNGISQDHKHCYTIFSSSYYCYGTNSAAVIILNENENSIQHHKFATNPIDIQSYENDKRFLLSTFKTYLDREASTLIGLFKQDDINQSGWIDLNIWSKILSKYIYEKEGVYIYEKHFITLKDHLCPCNEKDKTAEYLKMFSNTRSNQTQAELYEFLDMLFSLIDLDHNGKISSSEATKAINLMNKSLGTEYDGSFISSLDKNRDGLVDLNEFKLGFSKAHKLDYIVTSL